MVELVTGAESVFVIGALALGEVFALEASDFDRDDNRLLPSSREGGIDEYVTPRLALPRVEISTMPGAIVIPGNMIMLWRTECRTHTVLGSWDGVAIGEEAFTRPIGQKRTAQRNNIAKTKI